jgi:hypothetical protein
MLSDRKRQQQKCNIFFAIYVPCTRKRCRNTNKQTCVNQINAKGAIHGVSNTRNHQLYLFVVAYNCLKKKQKKRPNASQLTTKLFLPESMAPIV